MVEVSDTTLAYDRNVKPPLYASAGIPATWIVDLSGGVVTFYFGPERGSYENSREQCRGDEVSSETVPGLSLSVDEILGR